MKLEITIKATKSTDYNTKDLLVQKKDIEITEVGCVKIARNAIDRVVDEFLFDLKEIQRKAEILEEETAAKAKKEKEYY